MTTLLNHPSTPMRKWQESDDNCFYGKGKYIQLSADSKCDVYLFKNKMQLMQQAM